MKRKSSYYVLFLLPDLINGDQALLIQSDGSKKNQVSSCREYSDEIDTRRTMESLAVEFSDGRCDSRQTTIVKTGESPLEAGRE